jgi:uncharacterized SAM-binding protein YcdF (DUF218 family)
VSFIQLAGQRTRSRARPRVAGILLTLALAYVGMTFLQVWWASRQDNPRPAGAIVVLGAAQYDGEPSPVLRARLDHAAKLYADGVAPVVVVTGGSRPGDRFTEARAAAEYLYPRGVPDAAQLRENTGRTTYESLAATARFLAARGISDVVLVSDPFHAHRSAAIAQEVGLDASVSPTPSTRITGRASLRRLLRETAAVALGRLIGYRRLDGLLGFG